MCQRCTAEAALGVYLFRLPVELKPIAALLIGQKVTITFYRCEVWR